jgi:hypothetical protein
MTDNGILSKGNAICKHGYVGPHNRINGEDCEGPVGGEMIGTDFPETSASIWCPACGDDGYWHISSSRSQVPPIAVCKKPTCRVAIFRTD